MHKDQERVALELPQRIIALSLGKTEQAVLDCTVLNRALIQGPDPLFLMLTGPDQFEALCRILNVPVEDGRKAITDAHERGPAVLLDGVGLSPKQDLLLETLSPKQRHEMLWLLLASVSDCTEEGYKAGVTMQERFQRISKAVAKLAYLLVNTDRGHEDIEDVAGDALDDFIGRTPTVVDLDGHIHTNRDHGFYVLYKLGYKVVAVHTSGPTFWGTTPDTTLEEQGVHVDKKISPQFGLVFDNSAERWFDFTERGEYEVVNADQLPPR